MAFNGFQRPMGRPQQTQRLAQQAPQSPSMGGAFNNLANQQRQAAGAGMPQQGGGFMGGRPGMAQAPQQQQQALSQALAGLKDRLPGAKGGSPTQPQAPQGAPQQQIPGGYGGYDPNRSWSPPQGAKGGGIQSPSPFQGRVMTSGFRR